MTAAPLSDIAAAEPQVAHFRPPLAGSIGAALLATAAAYGWLRWSVASEAGLLARYPFGIAAAVGLLFALMGIAGWRRRGVCAAEVGLSVPVSGVAIPWEAIDAIDLMELRTRDKRGATQVVRVSGGGQEILFGSAPVADPELKARMQHVPGAAMLLALVVARAGGRADLAPLTPPPGQASPGSPDPPSTARLRLGGGPRAGGSAGILGLLFKAGPKALKIAGKLLKTIKPGAALLTVGVYSLVFSWQFGVALVVLIGIHECGHVYAMWRAGISVKGIYFVPFFGGAAVAQGIAGTRVKNADIALNGPLWGTVTSLLLLGGYLASGRAWPLLAALASWNALINLFNLLPIMPLDGGRVLSNLAYSFHRSYGAVITAGSILLGGVLAYLWGLELLVLMVIIGLLELSQQMGALPVRPALALMAPHPFDDSQQAHFSELLQPRGDGRGATRLGERQRQQWRAWRQEADQLPMSGGEMVQTVGQYVVMVAILLGMMWLLADVPGGGDPMELLR